MNTNALAKLYDRLKPQERLPLIVAAVDRGDRAEADRLSRSAPRIHVGLPDYHGLGEGLLFLSLFHTINQLDLAVLFWHAQGLSSEWEQIAVDANDRARSERMWDMIQLLAYRLCVEADAWRLLWGDMHVDPETLLRDLPCYSTIQLAERAARGIVCTPDEAATIFGRIVPGNGKLPTVEASVQMMRAIIDDRVAWWG